MISLFQNKKSIDDVIHFYGEENTEIVHEYLDFLIDNEFGFSVDTDEFDCKYLFGSYFLSIDLFFLLIKLQSK